MSESLKPFQLPLEHADYQYPQARNPYAVRLKEFDVKAFSDSETEAHAGQWRTEFLDTEPSTPLIVEIGCNTGHVIRAWAEKTPAKRFIGVDWKFKAIHRGIEKASKKGLKNILFLRANIWRISQIFGREEIDEIHIYCPDPWPTKSTWKKRFLRRENFPRIHSVLKAGGLLHIKTDHAGYFDWIEESLAGQEADWE
ncbi:MAG: methyltransferase domain-containing protein, partial [Proteobacteria bacterium]